MPDANKSNNLHADNPPHKLVIRISINVVLKNNKKFVGMSYSEFPKKSNGKFPDEFNGNKNVTFVKKPFPCQPVPNQELSKRR